METVDAYFSRAVQDWQAETDSHPDASPPFVGADVLRALFAAQLQSRHVDFAARWLQSEGKGYYTIGSAGHESNAALGLVTRVDDPALLHYRSGGFYLARAGLAGKRTSVRHLLLSLTSSRPSAPTCLARSAWPTPSIWRAPSAGRHRGRPTRSSSAASVTRPPTTRRPLGR